MSIFNSTPVGVRLQATPFKFEIRSVCRNTRPQAPIMLQAHDIRYLIPEKSPYFAKWTNQNYHLVAISTCVHEIHAWMYFPAQCLDEIIPEFTEDDQHWPTNIQAEYNHPCIHHYQPIFYSTPVHLISHVPHSRGCGSSPSSDSRFRLHCRDVWWFQALPVQAHFTSTRPRYHSHTPAYFFNHRPSTITLLPGPKCSSSTNDQWCLDREKYR